MSSTISPVTHSLGFEESVDKRPADALPENTISLKIFTRKILKFKNQNNCGT